MTPWEMEIAMTKNALPEAERVRYPERLFQRRLTRVAYPPHHNTYVHRGR